MALSLAGLSFGYGQKTVLDNIACRFAKGHLHVILGVNGAGKSTLLKLLDRQNKPVSGKIFLGDVNLAELSTPDIARRIAYVPHRHELSDLTVADYLLVGRKPYISWNVKKSDEDVVIAVLERLHLKDLAFRPLFELSSGELQKTALACALVQEPEVLLLDEPTSNLDLKNQHEVMELIGEEVKDRRLTAIVAMHDINLALRYATAFTLLKDGRILAAGDRQTVTPENLRQLYGLDLQMQSFGAHTVVFAG